MRKIDAAREEGSALLDVPPAEVTDIRQVRGQPVAPIAADVEHQDEYDEWFNRAVSDAWEQMCADSLQGHQEAEGE